MRPCIVSYTRDSLGTKNHLSDTTELVLEWRERGRVREREAETRTVPAAAGSEWPVVL